MTQLGEAFIPIRATLEKLDKDLSDAKGKIEGALGKLDGDVGKSGGALGKALGNLGGPATLAAGSIAAVTAAAVAVGAAGVAGVAALGIALYKVGEAAVAAWAKFDEGRDAIILGTGASGEALAEMEGSMISLSETTAGVNKTQGEIGGTIAEVNTRLGLTGEALEETTGAMLTYSRVTGQDGVKATQDITRLMGDWGVEADQTTSVLDKLIKAGQDSGIGVDKLANSLVQSGAPLRQMGFSLDEGIAIMAKWEKEGVNTETILSSLRIGVTRFADAQTEANTTTTGGVESMAEAEAELEKLKGQLELARLKQAEFTETTKESTRVQSEMKIGDLTTQITELEAAMALGEQQTITTAASEEALADSFQSLLDRLRAAPTDIDAVNIAVEAMGAKAGPDFAAAVREGRFEFDNYLASIEGSGGTLQDVADRTLDFSDKMPLMWQKVSNSLIPVGQSIMDVADSALPLLESGFETVAAFIRDTVVPIVQDLSERLQAWITEITPDLQAKLGELQAKFGEWADYVKTTVFPIIMDVAGGLMELYETVVPSLMEVWHALSDVWKQSLGPALADLFAALGEIGQALGLTTGETSGLGAVILVVKGILGPVIFTLEALALLIRLVGWSVSETITIFSFLASTLYNTVANALRTVTMGLDLLSAGFRIGKDYVGRFLEGIRAVPRMVGDALRRVQEFASALANAIPNAIKAAINYVKDFIRALGDIVIPPFLRPGSPTPFELGLKGIGRAAREAGQSLSSAFSGLPDFGPQISGLNALQSAGAMAGEGGEGAGGGVSKSWNLTINSPLPPNVNQSFDMLQAMEGA